MSADDALPAGGNDPEELEPEVLHAADVPDDDAEAAEAAGLLAPEEAIQAWERQEGESAAAYHAFCHYRDTTFGASS